MQSKKSHQVLRIPLSLSPSATIILLILHMVVIVMSIKEASKLDEATVPNSRIKKRNCHNKIRFWVTPISPAQPQPQCPEFPIFPWKVSEKYHRLDDGEW